MKMISRLIALGLALMFAVSATCISAFADGANVKVDMSVTYQTIEGWGASYTWYGDYLTTNDQAEQGYDWIFNDTEFNILRFRDLHNATPGEDKVARDGYKPYKAYYDAAVARGIDPIVLVTRWECFEKNLSFLEYVPSDEDRRTYWTLKKDKNGEYMYDALAKFYVESIKLFFEAGIPVHYFSISNETEWQRCNSADDGKDKNDLPFYLAPEENEYHAAYWKAHVALYKAFDEAFGEWAPKITAAEVMADWKDVIKSYVDPLEKNAPETFDTIAHHLYGSENSVRSFSEVGKEYYGKYHLWQSEIWYDGYIEQAEVIANELTYEGINAYLYWNGVWLADTGRCLIEVESSAPTAAITRKGNHYIMMHYSKYIKPGYQRVDVSNSSKAAVVAFKAPDSSRLVMVAVNRTADYQDVQFDLGNANILDSMVYQTVGNEGKFKFKYWQDAGKYSDGKNELPPYSVTTFVLDLPADPNYVAPVKNTSVNPFLKQPKGTGSGSDSGSSSAVPVAVIAVVAVVAVAVVAAVVMILSKKKKSA